MTTLFRSHRLLVMLALAVGAAGCDFGSVTPTAPDQTQIVYSQTDLTVGTGAEATVGKTVTVQYGGWLYSDTAADHKGKQFGSEQFSYTVGATNIIKGFDQGVTGMKAGGQRRLVVPPTLAYGSTGNGSTIPANAALVFDVTLVSVQ